MSASFCILGQNCYNYGKEVFMSINANNYIELAKTQDTFYVLTNGKGMYFVRDFDKPSLEHPMFCSRDVREATRYESMEKANDAHFAIMSWHCAKEDVNRLAQTFLTDCKPQRIVHSERFEIPKDAMVRGDENLNSRHVVADFVDIFGGK